jgi:uncharacterized protein
MVKPTSEPARHYNSYGKFLKEMFGCRVYKVSVDAGFSCPNRDGSVSSGGCTYCNNDSFRPRSAERLRPVSAQMEEGIGFLRQRFGARKFIAYFQPYTNTYAPLDTLIPLYEAALNHPDVVGLSLGTRPDCMDKEKLAWLETRAKTHFITVEYGLQSIYDTTLERINRGHDFRCWTEAMEASRDRGIWLGTHLILGFHWETREQMLHTADVLSTCGLHFLKLHQLHIVRHTALECEYRKSKFPLLSLEEYAELVVDFLERLDPSICIERLFGTAPEDTLVAPLWGKSKHEIRSFIERRFAARRTCQGIRSTAGPVRL